MTVCLVTAPGPLITSVFVTLAGRVIAVIQTVVVITTVTAVREFFSVISVITGLLANSVNFVRMVVTELLLMKVSVTRCQSRMKFYRIGELLALRKNSCSATFE